jgi:hypothetical protein
MGNRPLAATILAAIRLASDAFAQGPPSGFDALTRKSATSEAEKSGANRN